MDPKTDALLGGRKVDIVYRDGSVEVVTVRQLTLRQLADYARAFESEARSIELFCGQPDGWADTLAIESAERIIQVGEELNLDFLTRQAARGIARQEKVMPGVVDRAIQLAMTQNAAPFPSITGALTSPSKPG